METIQKYDDKTSETMQAKVPTQGTFKVRGLRTHRRRLIKVGLPLKLDQHLAGERRAPHANAHRLPAILRRLHDDHAALVDRRGERRRLEKGRGAEGGAPVAHEVEQNVQRDGAKEREARERRGQVGGRQARLALETNVFVNEVAKLAQLSLGDALLGSAG